MIIHELNLTQSKAFCKYQKAMNNALVCFVNALLYSKTRTCVWEKFPTLSWKYAKDYLIKYKIFHFLSRTQTTRDRRTV